MAAGSNEEAKRKKATLERRKNAGRGTAKAKSGQGGLTSARKLAGAAASPQAAAINAGLSHVPGGEKINKQLNKRGVKLIWKILLWSLPLSVPIILMFFLLFALVLLLGL